MILAADVSLAEEQVLYWMVDDSVQIEVNGTDVDITDYLNPDNHYIENPQTYYAARIRVTGGETDTFLPLYYPGGVTGDGDVGVELWGNNGFWGAGVPTGLQSPIGSYNVESPEYSFIVEIGNVSWDESSGVASWVETVAESASATYTQLADANYIAQNFDINPPAEQKIWTGTSYKAVPEPSGGLLLLVGGALLALRRRRNGGA